MRHLAGALVVASLVASTGSGCAREQEALIVLRSVAPTVMDDSCEFEVGGEIGILIGTLDVSAGDPYVLAPVLLNNLPSRAVGSTNSGVDDSELQLSSTVDITLNVPSEIAQERGLSAAGDVVPLSYGQPVATDSIAPGEETTIVMDIVRPDVSESLAAAIEPGQRVQITAEIQFSASRSGNARGNLGVVDARLYTFPIVLCNGCMVTRCECDASDSCVPGTESFERECLRAQDSAIIDPPFCEAIADGLPPAVTTGTDDTATTTTDTGAMTDTSDAPPDTTGPGGTG